MNWKKKLTACILVTGTLTTIIYAINKLVNYIATREKLLTADKDFYYDWRFGRIYYTKTGDGSPILLVHDLNVTSSGYEWNKIIDTLSKSNTVYTLDLLGCGRSDKPWLTYTNFLYVQLITDFIKHNIGKKTNVIASGGSGTFILSACANDNSVIDKMILINPKDLISLAKIPTKRTKALQHLICFPIIGTFLYNILVNKKTIENDFYHDYFEDKSKITDQTIMTYFESSQKEKTHSKFLYASIVSRFTNANIICNLRNLTNSIFIFTGNADPDNIIAAAQYQEYLPSIEVIDMDNSKYLPQMETPREFIEQINILFEL